MRIRNIKPLRLRAAIPPKDQVRSRGGLRAYRSTVLVQVETDEGVTGFGSCSGNGAVLEAAIVEILAPLLVGKEYSHPEEVWEYLYFGAGGRALGSRGIGVVALSGVDIALWDILGKTKNLPLFELLGGASRERVEVYATALYPDKIEREVQRALRFAELGYRGVKVKLGFDLNEDGERLKAVRSAVGKEFPIMTDANMGYELNAALKIVPVLEECGAEWFEEPLFAEDVDGHARLRSRCRVPIALGENLHTRFAFEDFIARGGVDILQPDVARAGGISEIKKLGQLADRHGLPISFHTWGDAVSLAASLHLTAALKSSTVMELDCSCNPLRTELLMEPLVPENGLMTPPDGAGLGIEIDLQALRKFEFAGKEEVNVRQPALRAV